MSNVFIADRPQAPSEIRTWLIDLSDRLPTNATISGVVASHLAAAGTTLTPSVLSFANGLLKIRIGPFASSHIANGHILSALATLSDNQIFNVRLVFNVRFPTVSTEQSQSRSETLTWEFDFNPDLQSGVTVASATATLTNPAGSVVSPDPTVGVIANNIVPVRVTASQLAATGTYSLDCLATLSDGDKSLIRLQFPVPFA